MYSNFIHQTLTLEATRIPCKLFFIHTIHSYLVMKRVKLGMQTNTRMNPLRVRQDEDYQPLNAMCA